MKIVHLLHRVSFTAICGVALVVFSGCNEGRINVLLAASADMEKANVEQEDIQSLVVTVTGINLLKTEGAGEEVPLTVTPVDIDLMQLDGVAALINSATVPTGIYNQIRLDVDNPRLVLVSEPDTVITDVHFAANSRFMVAERFAVYAGTSNNIVLDIDGIHLVSEGNGGYTLTPMLRARFRDDTVPMLAQGLVVSVDTAAGSMVLGLSDADIIVGIADAAIYLPTDTETASGIEEDLIAGAEVIVEGTVNAGGIIKATKITIVPPSEE